MKIHKRLQNGNEIIHICEYPNGKFYNHYITKVGGPFFPAVAGPFDTLEQAVATAKKHRPKAEEIPIEEAPSMVCRNVAREKLNLYIKLYGNPDKPNPRENFFVLAPLLSFAVDIGAITNEERIKALEPIKEAAFAAPKMEAQTMRQMTPAQMRGIQAEILYILEESVSDDYARYILDAEDYVGITFMESVIQDVLESSDWDKHGHYNDSDIRSAIGRQLTKRLGIEC